MEICGNPSQLKPEARCQRRTERKLVEILIIYLTITRSDLSYLIVLLSQFMKTHRNLHLDCAKQVLRYVSGTMNYDILYKSATPIRLEGYRIVNWAVYKVDKRTTSVIFSLDNGAISWSSKKQPTVAMSSTEAEYRVHSLPHEKLFGLRGY